MSCYESERGAVVIPESAWASLRKAMIDAYNAHQERCYRLALRVYEGLVAEGKRQAEPDYDEMLNWGDFPDRFSREADAVGEAGWDQIVAGALDGNGHPVRPDAGEWVKLPDDAHHIPVDDEAAFSFDDATRTLHWGVGENNHAVEHAHEEPLTRGLFAELRRIHWTEGTGGQIVMKSEFNGESVTHDFGPHMNRPQRGYYR